MSKRKFVTLKEIAAALEISERNLRRKSSQLGIEKSRDKAFPNRYIASRAREELSHRGYEVAF